MTSNQKKALKAEHTNRLKNAFVKALQQEQVNISTLFWLAFLSFFVVFKNVVNLMFLWPEL